MRLHTMAAFAASLLVSSLGLYAQTPNANFGTVYTPKASQVTISVRVDGTYAIRGQFYGGGSLSTVAGTITAASGFYIAGQGQYLYLPVTFQSSGTSGSLSGSFTAHYTCSGDCTQSTLNVTISTGGNNIVASASASPAYYVLSLLYDPPGDQSSSGFSNQSSAGSSTSISQNFDVSTTLSFTAGFFGAGAGVTFGSGVTTGTGSSFTTTYQAASGAQLGSVQQAIDHNQDQFFLLVDPTFTLTQTGSNSAQYVISPSVDATGNFGSTGTPHDILNVNVLGLKTPSQIPVDLLKPQVVTAGTTLPGLSFVCAHPLPAAQCTQANACGCVASDFAGIVAQDPLVNASQTTAPNSIDSARFVYLTHEALQGPQQSGSGPVKTTYSISDSTMSGMTTSNGTSYSVGYKHQWSETGLFSLTIDSSTTFKYSQTQTAGTQNGHAHTATVTLGSDKVGCIEYADIYEDTTYHTFAFALPQAPPAACN